MHMKTLILVIISTMSINIVLCQETGILFDLRDEHTYKTVQFGDQTWMAENLIFDTKIGSWFYDNDTANGKICGRLYTWQQAKKSCPVGWHLPSPKEWETLINFVYDSLPLPYKKTDTLIHITINSQPYPFTYRNSTNKDSIDYSQPDMKILHTSGLVTEKYWNSSDSEHMSTSGFDVLPGGRTLKGYGLEFVDLGLRAFFWTDYSDYYGTACFVGFSYNNTFQAAIGYYYSKNGMSVRCVKD